MEISLTSDGRPVGYKIELDENDSFCFTIGEGDGWTIPIDCPLQLNKDFEGKDFDTYLLTSPKVKENNAGQVFCKERRIGWIIPALSLASNLHDFSGNEHFLKYAYIALRDCIRAKTIHDWRRAIEVSGRESLTVLDLFDESKAFLVVSRETLDSPKDFELQRAVASLVSCGFMPASEGDEDRYNLIEPHPEFKKYKILVTSEDIGEYLVIYSLLKSYLESGESPVLRFFYLYQIMEMLLEKVFSCEQVQLAREIVEAGSDLVKVKDILEKVNKYTSEKKRMSLLIEEYTGIPPYFGSLIDACNDLLDQLYLDSGQSLNNCLYPVRNFVFHRYRALPESSDATLEEINLALADVLSHLLSAFKEKSTGRDPDPGSG